MLNKSTLFFIILVSTIAAVIFTFYSGIFIRPIPALDSIGSPQATSTPTVSPTGELSDLIKINEPFSGQTVKSPLLVAGEARGYWFFEASFPVRVYDDNGLELGVAVAQANPPAGGDWMTEDFVPFKAVLYFKKPATTAGTLVLEKDNPSGLSENAAELKVPVSFDLAGWAVSADTCKPTGCSGQICSDEDVVTTCEYKAEYACYKTAKCERQEDGKCGWTPTEELVACLSAAFQAEEI